MSLMYDRLVCNGIYQAEHYRLVVLVHMSSYFRLYLPDPVVHVSGSEYCCWYAIVKQGVVLWLSSEAEQRVYEPGQHRGREITSAWIEDSRVWRLRQGQHPSATNPARISLISTDCVALELHLHRASLPRSSI